MFYDPNGKPHRPTEAGVRKCIPRRFKPYVEGVEIDRQGIWVYLNRQAVESRQDCHTIHAYSLKELRQEAKEILILPNPRIAFFNQGKNFLSEEKKTFLS